MFDEEWVTDISKHLEGIQLILEKWFIEQVLLNLYIDNLENSKKLKVDFQLKLSIKIVIHGYSKGSIKMYYTSLELEFNHIPTGYILYVVHSFLLNS